ncbi:MmcQ/YjbR family DNA-binding protein [Thermomonospora amylolytica]|uniref:MmcQ/YjbR family DNA-binding protein n=1 Tax=Thermomonospora amylolytica TaxID=1411117 RepID=UPI000E6BC361|nr:MmcQ/YjbR family DNA-binding protein [Thermomonospora amylolytica]
MGTSRDDDPRQRVIAICSALPEATAESGQHIVFRVRGKTFAYYTDDHHGDGRLTFQCKAAPDERQALLDGDGRRYFVPPYVGPRGWIGVYLDVPDVDWAEIGQLAADSYRMIAPKRLAAQV